MVGSFREREGRWKSKDRGLSLSLSRSEVKVKAKTGIALNILRGAKTNGRTVPSQRYVEAFAFFIFGNHGMSDRRTDGLLFCAPSREIGRVRWREGIDFN